METPKRFRIFNADEQSIIAKVDTTYEAYNVLINVDRSEAHYFIDDTIDDIEVDADEFMEAWEAGERPSDLQMF